MDDSVAAAEAGQADRSGVLSYLDQSAGDLDQVGMILADPDLAMFDDDSDDEGLTRDEIAQSIALLSSYRETVTGVIDALTERPMPGVAGLDDYRTSEAAMLELLYDLLLEFEQILHYSDVLMVLGEDLQSLSYFDENDLEGTYQVFQTSLTGGAALLQRETVPSFLASMNEDLIDALTQMNEAVRYTLVGVALNDPLRLDSADYRMDILLRRFDSIMSRVDRDMEDRQAKLAEEIDRIKGWHSGLDQWVDENTALLSESGEVSP